MSWREARNRDFRIREAGKRIAAAPGTDSVEAFLARGGKIDRQPEAERRDYSPRAMRNAILARVERRKAAESEMRELLTKPESTP